MRRLVLVVPALCLALGVSQVHAAEYLGNEVCADCHRSIYEKWQGSHHDLAMQPANETTVLGDFNDRVFEHRGVKTRFYRENDQYLVETENAQGEPEIFEAAYTFGVTPLQQYLLRYRDGRYQALTVAWDTRSAEEGGQRWFHLYPDEQIPPGDELHWTAPAHNWNFACAECHSTDLRKNYDAQADSYATTWSEIDVGCEACHGPGSDHVVAARAAENQGVPYPSDHGLVVDLKRTANWYFPAGSPTARLSGGVQGASEPELCGRCHSRRSQISEDYRHGRSLSDTHRVQLLTEGMYFPDGQILDEVYVYGSFVQSRMHAAGVTCSDCHESHSLKLKLDGDAVCLQCHSASHYQAAKHHFHPPDSDSARCVACHMPERTYMVVDPRRDHSMRIPRPDLSDALGTPNVCTDCHVGRSNQWAADQLDAWYGPNRHKGYQAYATALDNARRGAPNSGRALESLILKKEAPAIARATAVAELGPYLSPSSMRALVAALADESPMVRRAAVEVLEPTDLSLRWQLLAPMLEDPVRGVRVAAASALADMDPQSLGDPKGRSRLEKAFDEYLSSELLNADRVEHWVNVAGFHGRRGDIAAAEMAYQEARRRSPAFVPIYANQADLYRSLQRDADGERVLREGIGVAAEAPALHHALGLLLVREKRMEEAIQELGEAFRLSDGNPRYGYVYGIALNSADRTPAAIKVWEQVLKGAPDDVTTLFAMITALRDSGDMATARVYADRLVKLVPSDTQVQALRRSLGP